LALLIAANAAWAVDRRVPEDHPTIAAALVAAAAGDRVIVSPGSYAENVELKSNVEVRGREAARVRLSAASDLRPVVTIDGVVNVVLANVTFVDAGEAVRVRASDSVTIASSVFSGIRNVAVQTDFASDVDVFNNVFFDNGVAITRAANDTHVRNNIFMANDDSLTGGAGFGDNNTNVSFNCFFENGTFDRVYGTSFQTGDPRFVNTGGGDFHLQQGSACIDIGSGTDVIDNTIADAGAYGGGFADVGPYPVQGVTATDASGAAGAAIDVAWQPNLAYLVTSSTNPGGYRLYYSRNAAGPPFNGSDAGGGTQPSPIDVGQATTFRLASLQPAAPTTLAPRLLAAAPRDTAIALSWTAAQNASGYRVLYGVAAVDENHVDVAAVTAHTVTGLVNGTTYRFAVLPRLQAAYHVAVTALDSTQNRHESALSTTATLSIGPITDGPRSNGLAAIPSVTIPVPDLPDEGGCFIATAAYRSDSAAPVLILRDFRDRYLLPHAAGRAFVRAYYRVSPALSRSLDDVPQLRAAVRAVLAPLVAVALLLVASSAAAKSALAALLAALIVLRARWPRAILPRGGP
jgi:hypothetical protein